MDTLAQFTARFKSKGKARAPKMASLSIGYKAALEIANDIDWDAMRSLADAAREYLPQVEAELATLRQAHAAHPERMTRRAVLFGIATPNCDETDSIGWALAVEPWFHLLAPRALAHRSYRSLVNGQTGKKIGRYDAITTCVAELQRWSSFDDITVEKLESLYGVGPKVARMTQAVLNPAAHAWTVDLWHMRQLLWASGREYGVRVAAGNAQAYRIMEAIWLEYAERYFPGVDTFAVQWATWNVANGQFESHAALWQDLAA